MFTIKSNQNTLYSLVDIYWGYVPLIYNIYLIEITVTKTLNLKHGFHERRD